MKKQDLTTLAMIGISAGLLVGGCQNSDLKGNSENGVSNLEQMSPDMQSFYNSLSSEAQQKFMQLDAHGKMMAMEMATQSCKGQNACKGMGGCATSKNTCAGKNSCKGQGGAPVKDADEAVHSTHYHQMKKQNGNDHHNSNGNGRHNKRFNGNGHTNGNGNGHTNGNGNGSSRTNGNGNGSSSTNGNGNDNGHSMKKNGGGSNSCAGPGGCGSK